MEVKFLWSPVHCFPNGQAMPPKNKEELTQFNSRTTLASTVFGRVLTH
jgi:hypothetical protein